jgi:CBS domain-containing protein
MERGNVGALAIVDDTNRPVGMLTDRDIVQHVLRRSRDPDTLLVEQVMSLDVANAWEELPLERAFHRMRQEAVRRILVTDDAGKLVGILTYDDALPLIARELSLAADVVSAQYPSQAEA